MDAAGANEIPVEGMYCFRRAHHERIDLNEAFVHTRPARYESAIQMCI